MKYFLDHPQIKRKKAWGNGSMPGDTGAQSAEKAADKHYSAHNKEIASKGVRTAKSAEHRSEGDAIMRDIVEPAKKAPESKPKTSSSSRIGERPSKDKVM